MQREPSSRRLPHTTLGATIAPLRRRRTKAKDPALQRPDIRRHQIGRHARRDASIPETSAGSCKLSKDTFDHDTFR